jgi:hypothetical protein
MSAQSAPLRLPASSLSPLLPFPLFPLSVLTLLPPLGRPLLNAVLSSRSPHITLVQTTSLSPFRQPYWLACLVSGNRSYFDNLISLRPVPRAPLLVPVSSRRLDVHTVSSFLLASGRWVRASFCALRPAWIWLGRSRGGSQRGSICLRCRAWCCRSRHRVDERELGRLAIRRSLRCIVSGCYIVGSYGRESRSGRVTMLLEV